MTATHGRNVDESTADTGDEGVVHSVEGGEFDWSMEQDRLDVQGWAATKASKRALEGSAAAGQDKKQLYRGGERQWYDPQHPCDLHGNTMFKCKACGVVECTACRRGVMLLVSEGYCKECRVKEALETGRFVDEGTPDEYVAGAKGMLSAAMEAISEQQQYSVRLKTMSAYVYKVMRIKRWANFIKMTVRPEHLTAEIRCLWIYHRVKANDITAEGKKFMEWTGSEKPATYEAILNDMTVFNNWAAASRLEGNTVEDYSEHAEVVQAKQWAKDEARVTEGGTKPFPLEKMRAYAEERMRSSCWMHCMFVLAILGITFSLIRRAAFAAIAYEEQGEYSDEPCNYDEVEAQVLLVHFSVDEDRDPTLRLIAKGEKNQKKNTRTMRFLTDKNVTGIPVVTWLKTLLQRLKMPTGPLLRRCKEDPNDGSPWMFGDKEWTALFDDLHGVTAVARPMCVSTTFRKCYATAMAEAGIPDEDIRAIGYWFTDVFKVYAGASRMPRLRAQKQTGGGSLVKKLQMLEKQLKKLAMGEGAAAAGAGKPSESSQEAARRLLNLMMDAGEKGLYERAE